MQPDVLEIITQKYDLRHIVDLIDVDLDLDLFNDVMHDLAITHYKPNERAVILLHDTDYCEAQSLHGHTLYNFVKLCARYDVPTERLIFITNHHGIGQELTRLCETVANTAAPLIIETVLWYDFPQPAQIPPDPAMDNYQGRRLYVCPNNRHRRHRMFLLTCLAHADLLSQGSVSYHFGPCN